MDRNGWSQIDENKGGRTSSDGQPAEPGSTLIVIFNVQNYLNL
jgi:hypothetical protein